MKRHWELEDLIDHFTIILNEIPLIGSKTQETKLGFAVLLKFFQYEARFPNSKNEIPKVVVQYIAKQIEVSENLFEKYDMSGRTYYSHKAQIREYYKFREPTASDSDFMAEWLSKQVFYNDADIENLKEEAYNKFRDLHIEPPSVERMERLIKSAIHSCESQFFQETYNKLSKEHFIKMDNLISSLTSLDESQDVLNTDIDDNLSFSELRSDAGRIGLDSILKEVMKLKIINQLDLPQDLFNAIPQKGETTDSTI